MADYIKSELHTTKPAISCPAPSCNSAWSWQLVNHVINDPLFQPTQLQIHLAKHYLTNIKQAKICPHCQAYMINKSKKEQVKCTSCRSLLKRTGGEFLSDFKQLETAYAGKEKLCWKCLKLCSRSYKCDNCYGGQDPRIQHIREGGYIMYTYFNGHVPRVRACPKCGILIQYMAGCAHMTCVKCSHQFCIKCLGYFGASNNHYSCKVAPMQIKDLPYQQEVIAEKCSSQTFDHSNNLSTGNKNNRRYASFSDITLEHLSDNLLF